jgi:serine-type D-Ala-D-Ala carboxypeptidase/endopeptidase (penicillin-binding protein 4)
MSRRTLGGCVLVAVACTAGAVWLVNAVRPVRARASSDTAVTSATPVWSARRVPTLLRSSVEHTLRNRATIVLTKRLDSVVGPLDACVAVDDAEGPVARVDAGAALAPASTLKLLTGTTALRRLGANHRFVTRVVDGANGDLVVVGAGDPLLATPSYIVTAAGRPLDHGTPFTPLANLADAIVASGVHRVDGALVVDDHLFDALRFLPAWKPSYATEGEIGALGALAVDRGFAAGSHTPAPDPAVAAGEQLAALLAARGVTIAGGVHRGRAPAGAREIAHVDSAPLSAMVAAMLTNSDNYEAEELLRALAVDAGVLPGTSAAGATVVKAQMHALGIPTEGLVMYDGSGLARGDRVACATLLALIERTTRPDFAGIDRGLAIAGRTGTLAGRFIGDSLAGRLRAKTGSIDGVVGLVGVIDGSEGLHFAFLANGDFGEAAGAQLQADIARAVGSTPDLRVPKGLVPAP